MTKRHLNHVAHMLRPKFADACLFLMNHYDDPEIINIGTGKDITIHELAVLIKKIIGYQGEISYNQDKPDGTPQKLLDVTKLKCIGWAAKTSLERGIEIAYKAYLKGDPNNK